MTYDPFQMNPLLTTLGSQQFTPQSWNPITAGLLGQQLGLYGSPLTSGIPQLALQHSLQANPLVGQFGSPLQQFGSPLQQVVSQLPPQLQAAIAPALVSGAHINPLVNPVINALVNPLSQLTSPFAGYASQSVIPQLLMQSVLQPGISPYGVSPYTQVNPYSIASQLAPQTWIGGLSGMGMSSPFGSPFTQSAFPFQGSPIGVVPRTPVEAVLAQQSVAQALLSQAAVNPLIAATISRVHSTINPFLGI